MRVRRDRRARFYRDLHVTTSLLARLTLALVWHTVHSSNPAVKTAALNGATTVESDGNVDLPYLSSPGELAADIDGAGQVPTGAEAPLQQDQEASQSPEGEGDAYTVIEDQEQTGNDSSTGSAQDVGREHDATTSPSMTEVSVVTTVDYHTRVVTSNSTELFLPSLSPNSTAYKDETTTLKNDSDYVQASATTPDVTSVAVDPAMVSEQHLDAAPPTNPTRTLAAATAEAGAAGLTEDPAETIISTASWNPTHRPTGSSAVLQMVPASTSGAPTVEPRPPSVEAESFESSESSIEVPSVEVPSTDVAQMKPTAFTTTRTSSSDLTHPLLTDELATMPATANDDHLIMTTDDTADPITATTRQTIATATVITSTGATTTTMVASDGATASRRLPANTSHATDAANLSSGSEITTVEGTTASSHSSPPSTPDNQAPIATQRSRGGSDSHLELEATPSTPGQFTVDSTSVVRDEVMTVQVNNTPAESSSLQQSQDAKAAEASTVSVVATKPHTKRQPSSDTGGDASIPEQVHLAHAETSTNAEGIMSVIFESPVSISDPSQFKATESHLQSSSPNDDFSTMGPIVPTKVSEQRVHQTTQPPESSPEANMMNSTSDPSRCAVNNDCNRKTSKSSNSNGSTSETLNFQHLRSNHSEQASDDFANNRAPKRAHENSTIELQDFLTGVGANNSVSAVTVGSVVKPLPTSPPDMMLHTYVSTETPSPHLRQQSATTSVLRPENQPSSLGTQNGEINAHLTHTPRHVLLATSPKPAYAGTTFSTAQPPVPLTNTFKIRPNPPRKPQEEQTFTSTTLSNVPQQTVRHDQPSATTLVPEQHKKPTGFQKKSPSISGSNGVATGTMPTKPEAVTKPPKGHSDKLSNGAIRRLPKRPITAGWRTSKPHLPVLHWGVHMPKLSLHQSLRRFSHDHLLFGNYTSGQNQAPHSDAQHARQLVRTMKAVLHQLLLPAQELSSSPSSKFSCRQQRASLERCVQSCHVTFPSCSEPRHQLRHIEVITCPRIKSACFGPYRTALDECTTAAECPSQKLCCLVDCRRQCISGTRQLITALDDHEGQDGRNDNHTDEPIDTVTSPLSATPHSRA